MRFLKMLINIGAYVFMVLCVVEYLVGILCLRYVRD